MTRDQEAVEAGSHRRIAGALRLAWPVALLLLFALAFRGGAAGVLVDRTNQAPDCETPPAGDLPVFERCLTLQSDDVELMIDLGKSYEAAGRWPDAEIIYRRALTVDSKDGDVHLRLGRLLLRRGDVMAARKEGDAALAVQPGNPAAVSLASAGRARP